MQSLLKKRSMMLSYGAAGLLGVSSWCSAVPTVLDAGFESPVQPVNNWEQANGTGGGSLAGSAWTFTPSAGISRNISPFQSGGLTAAQGQQLALIQGVGSISQTLSGFVPGESYSITYAASARACCTPNFDTDVRVFVDGQLVSGGLIRSESMIDHTSITFVATSATPTLTLSTTNPLGGDRTAFLDHIRINSLGVSAGPTLSNPSFEQGIPSNVFPQYGVVDGWASESLSFGTNDAGGPFVNGLPVPDGNRVGFIQRSAAGVQSLTQTVTGLTPGETYTIQYFENERGFGAATARPSVTVDGNFIVAEHDAVRTSQFRRVVSQSFMATSTTAELSLHNNTGSGDNTALFDNLVISRAVPIVGDGGFENPVQPPNNWEQANGVGGGSLAGSLWTITGGAGITRNISPFQNGGIPAPEGEQHALIQGTGSFQQLLTGFEANSAYQLNLLAMARQQGVNMGNDLEVILDEGLLSEVVLLDLDEITATSFSLLSSDAFIAYKNSYTLTIRASLNGGLLSGDRTTFIDDVHFVHAGDIPEPASATLAFLALGALGVRRRRQA